jgi:hypothetical protein
MWSRPPPPFAIGHQPVVSSNPAHGDVYLLQHYMIKYVADLWFSLGTPVSFTNKTDCHDTTEILLKVALNTISLAFTDTHCQSKWLYKFMSMVYRISEELIFILISIDRCIFITRSLEFIRNIVESGVEHHIPSLYPIAREMKHFLCFSWCSSR